MMTVRFPVLVAGLTALFSIGVADAKGAVVVSPGNFRSLRYAYDGGMLPVSHTYTLRNHAIFEKVEDRSGAAKPKSQSQALSGKEWQELLNQLKKANVPAIAGTYSQSGLMDASGDTLFLTLLDSAHHPQTFSISNSGHNAPQAFYTFARYLNELIARKFKTGG